MTDEQLEILADLRYRRLCEELKGPSAIARMHGITDSNWDVPADMMAVWNGWWDKPFDPNATPVPERQGNGGWMIRVGANQATYSRDGVRSFDVCRESSLMAFANLDPVVGTYWESVFPHFKVVHL